MSDATKRVYASDFRHFTAWCEEQTATSLPAEPTVVAAYLEHLADEGYKTSTISRRSSAISVVHQAAGEESPTRDARVRASIRGIRRALGSAVEQKTAFSSEDLRATLGSMGDELRDDRDRALLAVGFAGGFRRSELVALEVADLEEVPEGYRVTVRRSKADQDGRGMTKAIVYGRHDQTCPVRLLRVYLDRAGIGRNGASERAIAKQTGHRSVAVLRGYIEDATVFDDNAVSSLGL